MRRKKYSKLDELKARITKAFRLLKKENGIISRQNYLCCGSCAGYALADRIEKENKERPGRWNGAVYYHHQSNDNLVETGECYVAFGHAKECNDPSNVVIDDSCPQDTKDIGQCLVEALELNSVKTEWDGSPFSCVLIKGLEEDFLNSEISASVSGH